MCVHSRISLLYIHHEQVNKSSGFSTDSVSRIYFISSGRWSIRIDWATIVEILNWYTNNVRNRKSLNYWTIRLFSKYTKRLLEKSDKERLEVLRQNGKNIRGTLWLSIHSIDSTSLNFYQCLLDVLCVMKPISYSLHWEQFSI